MIKETIQFIREIYQFNTFIPLHAPVFGGKEKEYLMETIDSTFVSSVGAFVDKFEQELALLTNTNRAVATVNGTASLQVALRLVGVKEGEEVLTQALTFVATANAISYNQATPVFLDVDLDTMGLSPSALEAFLQNFGEKRENGVFNRSTGRRIAACLPMHTFGFPVRMIEILRICNEWDIPVVEDAAEALGSKINGQACGSFGALGTFSFNGNKIITCGGGGAIITQNDYLGEMAKYLTTTAKVPHPWEYKHDLLGYNFRMPNLNAALACAQLGQLQYFLADKRLTASLYKDFFEGIDNCDFIVEQPNTQANYWLMAIKLADKNTRNEFLKQTNEAGIMTRPIWQLMFRLPMYAHCQRDDQVNARYLEERVVNIPSSVKFKAND